MTTTTPQAVAAAAATTPAAGPAAGATPWVDGTLPSPWAAPAAGAAVPFAEHLEQARRTMDAALQPRVGGASSWAVAARAPADGLSQHFGLPSIEALGKRLSQGEADMARNIAGLAHLDPTSPDLPAQLLSVTLMSAKSGVSETIALKFASKVNENINTLMKTN